MIVTPRTWQTLSAAAIRVLTTAAHESTDSVDGLDFGDFLAQVLASTAANVGGPERLLARRPDSWEASHIAELLRATVGEEPDAWWNYRTQPLAITLNVAELIETGEHHPGLLGLDDAIDLVGARFTSADLDDDTVLDAWDAEIDQLIHRYKAEYREYAARFTSIATAVATAMAPPIDIHVTVDADPHSPWWNPTTVTNPTEDDADQLAVAIWHAAHDAAALPNVDLRPTPTCMSEGERRGQDDRPTGSGPTNRDFMCPRTGAIA